MTVQVICDSVEHWAATYDGPPFHAILTDPPYELSFMNKHWDGSGVSFQPATWAALAAHLLPGAHVLAFGLGRTHHRLMVAIEDAGMEIRDCIYYCFGQGFPKSLSVGKQLDKMAGKEREVIGPSKYHCEGRKSYKPDAAFDNCGPGFTGNKGPITAPATPAAATWEGYGSALKPAVEVIVMARKPLDGTIAANCQRYGSGALAIDACRVDGVAGDGWWGQHHRLESKSTFGASTADESWQRNPAGRWPANLVLSHLPGCKRVGTKRVKGSDRPGHEGKKSTGHIFNETPPMHSSVQHSDPDGLETVDAWECAPGCPCQLFPVARSSMGGGTHRSKEAEGIIFTNSPIGYKSPQYFDQGSAARFFAADWSLDQAEQLDAADVLRYCAKSSRAERDAGLDNLPLRDVPYIDYRENTKETKSWVTEYPDGTPRPMSKLRNAHPTVKPLTLCRYLATLLLPPAAYAPRRILIPFGGVASEAIGAMLAGWDEVVMVEREREYCDIAEARIAYWQGKMGKQIALPLEVLA